MLVFLSVHGFSLLVERDEINVSIMTDEIFGT